MMPKKMLTALCGALLVSAASCASAPAPAPEAPSAQDGGAATEETMTARVYFLSAPNFKSGTDPILLSVDRVVSKVRPAHGVLDAMFQGPRPSEADQGLMFVSSGATGYHGLKVENGVATVYLDGGCQSGGSSVTIADLITASLKQFPTVLHVRIYGPDGQTMAPSGPGDSIPACLKP